MAKPKTPEHLQRCEDAAAKLLQGKKKISHADVLRTFRLIKAADWPTQTRPNVAPTANPEVTGLVLGLSPNRQGGCSIAQGSQPVCESTIEWTFCASTPSSRRGHGDHRGAPAL